QISADFEMGHFEIGSQVYSFCTYNTHSEYCPVPCMPQGARHSGWRKNRGIEIPRISKSKED
ncbi:MAG TPA: hypothetical protein DDW42_00450, partial [Desulfobacteraceae bacterium]|nr:hypothetical protein [Desulfobacteraceae bacterium]